MWKRELVALAYRVVVFLVSCDCYCSVALLHGAMGWSAVFGYGNP